MKLKVINVFLVLILLTACEKYKEYENLETVETTYTGTVVVSESAGDIDGVFSGSNDSGAYGFIWDNPSKGAILDVDVFGNAGTVSFVVEDSRGDEVLNASVSGPSNTFSIEGKKGKWKVRVIFLEFDGEGSFDLNPVQ